MTAHTCGERATETEERLNRRPEGAVWGVGEQARLLGSATEQNGVAFGPCTHAPGRCCVNFVAHLFNGSHLVHISFVI